MPAVTVRLHGGLERHVGNAGPLVVNLPPGATLLELQDRLHIPRGEVALFLVDGELRREADVLDADARVDLYPLFGGG
jgi:hypothetical protein